MIKNIYLLCLILIILSCKEKNKWDINKEMLEYDQSLATIQNIKIVSQKKSNCVQLDNRLNFKFLEKKKIKINKIEFKDYSLLPNFWDLSYLKNSLVGYCYGVKSILGNNLYLYTEDFQNENKRFEENQYHQVGLLLIERNGYFVTWVKVCENDIDSEKSFESYLFDNYIISIETLNWNYDVIDETNKKEENFKYVVVEIKSHGNLVILNKADSEKIIEKYLPDRSDM